MEDSPNNLLYPVFFRLDKLKVLIVGAGSVGEEKLTFLLKSSPNANVTLISKEVAEETFILLNKYQDSNIRIIIKEIEQTDISAHDIIVAATNDKQVNRLIYNWAKLESKIVNVADTPDLCDFYMGSIVTRGSIKIAISTNGKSPTFSKRMRQFLEQLLDDNSVSLVENLNKVKTRLSKDFNTRVSELNDLTASLLDKKDK